MTMKINDKQKSNNQTIEEQTNIVRRLTKIDSWRTALWWLWTKILADKNSQLSSSLSRVVHSQWTVIAKERRSRKVIGNIDVD